jgi:isopenicillin-N N-acyltransferase-like protein
MPKKSFPRIRLKGSPLERGHQYGQQAASRIRKNIKIYEKVFQHAAGWDWERVKEQAQQYQSAITAYRPHFIEELHGISQGAGLSFEDLLALNVRTEIRNASVARAAANECTAFVALPERIMNGHTLLGQNWDWYTGMSETVVVLEVEDDDRPNFVTVVEAGLLAKAGMNAAGIGLATNALISELDTGEPGVPYHAILRGILEAENFSGAIRAINEHPRASAANYLVAHRYGEAFNAEAAPADYSRVYITFPKEDVYSHANHFLCKEIGFKDVGTWNGPGSLVRQHRIGRFLQNHHQKFAVEDFQIFLADHFNFPNAICCHPDPSNPEWDRYNSVASVIMDLNSATMWLAAGNPCEVPFDRLEYEGLLQ